MSMNIKMALMIALGAIVGALMRWAISNAFNGWIVHLKMGTLIANSLGCFLIGMALSAIVIFPISKEVENLIVTGFLGSLTTFSSFAGEVVQKLQASKYTEAFLVVGSHLFLGLLCTAIGFWIFEAIFKTTETLIQK